ncbi:MAG: HlyD family type I secretion periplasmic adaptor subunit [Pseudomonadales bacterium]|nr:HlyD family type I secretion periplasmic adaptor subunit [Pseudomonadales bacterium]
MSDSTVPKTHPELDFDDRKIRHAGLMIVLLTFFVFGVWAFWAPIGGAALAPGVVVVKSHSKTVQHLEGGIVKHLAVREGDRVNRGDVLIELDNTQSAGELAIVEGKSITLNAEEARLLAERDGPASVVYLSDWASATDERVAGAIQWQNQIFLARLSSQVGQKKVLAQRIEQLRSQETGLEQLKKSKQRLIVSYEEEVADLNALLKEGFADKSRLREFERSLVQTGGDIADLNARIAGIKIKIGETQLEVIQVETEFQEKVADRLGKAQSDLFELDERVRVLTDRVRRVSIVAPVDGMVVGLAVHTEGGVIAPGSALMEIIPIGESLMVEAEVQPVDIDRVKVGMIAEVRFSAFNRNSTPVLEGEVLTLSADRLVDEQTGAPYYLARITLTPESHASLEQLDDIILQPGMPAEVLIKTGDRTFFEYLSKPFSNMFARAFIED